MPDVSGDALHDSLTQLYEYALSAWHSRATLGDDPRAWCDRWVAELMTANPTAAVSVAERLGILDHDTAYAKATEAILARP